MLPLLVAVVVASIILGLVFLRRSPTAKHDSPLAGAFRPPTADFANVANAHPQARAHESDDEDDAGGPHAEAHGDAGRPRRGPVAERRRQERQGRQQAADAAAESRRKKREGAEEADAQRAEKEALKEKAAMEALAALRADAEQKRQTEYSTWKGLVSVDAAGETAVTNAEQEREAAAALRLGVLEAVNRAKVAVLQDIAAEVQQSVDTVVVALEAMLADGSLLGVFDDRGKFVVVTDAELADVAKFMRQRGRVSQQELLRECNRVIIGTAPN